MEKTGPLTKPATSGPYWYVKPDVEDFAKEGAPVKWGIYDKEIPDEALIHNLFRGGIGIHYNCPDGCSDLIESLSEVVGTKQKVLLSPYPNMDNKIALTAWEYLDVFDVFDKERIELFIQTHVNSRNAPEWNAPNMR